MWWLENSCVCYSNNMFQCVCGAADTMEEEVSAEKLSDLLKEAHVIIPSCEEADGSAFLNPIVRIGWFKNDESKFKVYRLSVPEKQDYLILKEKTAKFLERNRTRFHLED